MRIMHLFTNFHSGGQIQEVSDSYDGFRGYVWTEAVSGNLKKLRTQEYQDTCGRSLKVLLSSFQLHGPKFKPPCKARSPWAPGKA